QAGAEVVFVIHPLVPMLSCEGGPSVRARGLYAVMEQASRINGQNLLELGLGALAVRHPGTTFILLEPPREATPMFCSTMSLSAAHGALRYGYESTKAWLNAEGATLLRHLGAAPASAAS